MTRERSPERNYRIRIEPTRDDKEFLGHYNDDTRQLSCLYKTTKIVVNGIVISSVVFITYSLVNFYLF